jgi:hypothetical protein
MEPQRRDEEPAERDGCDRCSWREWETFMWFLTGWVAFVCIVVILSNAGRP